MRREKNRYIFAPDMKHASRRSRGLYVLLFLVLLVLTAAVINMIMVRQVNLESIKLTVMDLPADLEQYSILHISDLYGAELGEKQNAVKAALGSTRYSCVVMTGDMLGKDGDTAALEDLLALMPAETPKFMICGNSDGPFVTDKAHGTLSVYTEWAERLMSLGVTLLDRPVSVTRGKATVWFVPEELYTLDLDGLEYVYRTQLDKLNLTATALTADDAAKKRAAEYHLERIGEIRETVKQIEPGDVQIVLTHTPLTEEYVRDIVRWSGKEDTFSMRYASLILAGHYNGGQWRIPYVGAIWVNGLGWFPKDELIQGLSYLYAIPQYISPGLGNGDAGSTLPGRLFNTPTVTLLTLTRKVV